MLTQQDIYAASSENRPPMLNKGNYVPWSSHLLRYAKSRPNGKLIYNSIMNGLPEDIYAVVDSCETAQVIWLRVQQMMKGSDIGIQEKKAKLFNEWERFTSTVEELIESYYHRFSKLMNDFKRNKHFPETIASNLKFLNNLQPEWSRHVTIVHQTKDLHTVDYTQLYDFLKYNQKEVDDLRAERLAKTHDPLALMANSNNIYNYLVFHLDQPLPNCSAGYNLGQDRQMQVVGGNRENQFRQYVGQNGGNQNRNCNVVVARAKGNAIGNNGIQLQAEEFDLMVATADLDEIEEVNAKCILMANLQQASTFGTQTDRAPYTELLEPIPEPHQVQQNDSNVIYEVSSVEQDGGTVVQHPATVEETRAYFESLYNNLAIKVEKVNIDSHKLRETNADLTTKLARYKNQEKCFEISQEKYDKLERGDTATCSRKSLKMKQLNKEIKPANYTKINHLSGVFVSQTAKSREELYFSNTSKTANVSKSISIPNEEFSDDTTPSVARKFLNEVKSTIAILQRVVKQKMTLDIHNWSSSVHQDIHKIVKDEIFSIVNQVDARVQNFKIQYLKEATKFVRDFKYLAKEADESLAKHKALEFEIEHLLRAVVKRFENCIIKKENEYAKLWNDSYKKCEECKYDKISYDKAYNDMQQKIERLQAQLGDLKGKCKDTSCVSDTLDPLSQKLENENVELEFQVLNYAKENAHLKTRYKNLFDSISVSEQKDTTKGTSVNTQFRKQSILGQPPSSSRSKLYSVTLFPKSKCLPKIDETHALSKPVTSNSAPTPQELKVVKYDNVIAQECLGLILLRILRKKRVDNIAKTRRPQPRINTKNDRVPSVSKNSCNKNKEVKVEEHPRNLFLSKNKKHMSSECNNVKLAIRNDKSEVVCAKCKQCLITSNHDVCVLNYVNGMNSRDKKKKANVSKIANQKKHMPQVKKPKEVGSTERLVLPKPSKPRSCLRWSPTGRIFNFKGKIIDSSKSESQCHSNLFMVRRLEMLKAHDRQSEVSHKFRLEVLGNRKCKRASHPPKPVPYSKQRLHLLHMDLCSPMRVESINVLPQAPIIIVRTDNNTEFKNKVLQEYFNSVVISHQASSVRTPRQNRAEAIATACYTQIRSIIRSRFDKTPYELINSIKPDISFLYVFWALCYPKNNREDIRKLGAKGDIGFFIGYSANSCAYRVYNHRTKKIMETVNVTFDEISTIAFEQSSLKPGLQSMTSRQISSVLDLTYAPSTIKTQQPTECDLDLLFEAMHDDYIGGQPSAALRTVPAA
ncbi:retrovirus-related pol polyprotein from transposon TNT 1-94 [Tanacetum coccineum]